MKRNILFVILLVIVSGSFLQGIHFTNDSYYEMFYSSESISETWKEKLADSCGIPLPAINIALNGYYTLKSKNLLEKDSILTIIDFSNPSTTQMSVVCQTKDN